MHSSVEMQFNMRVLCIILAFSNISVFASSESTICSTPEKTPGRCIQIRYCPPLLNVLIKKPISQINVEYLQEIRCGFEGIHPKVCCALDDCMEPTAQEVVEVNTTDAISGINLLPAHNNCGYTSEDRIFPGDEAQIATYSWTVLLQYRTPRGLEFHCGGVLISKRYILTAANCVSDNSIDSTWSLTNVRLGEYDLQSDPDCEDIFVDVVCAEPAVNILIEKVIVHPSYNLETLAHDIALLRIAKDITFSDYIYPICLETTNANLISGRSSLVTGWSTDKTNGPSEDRKKKHNVKIEDSKECGSSFINEGVHLTNQLCATLLPSTKSYYGDIGGALHGFATSGQFYAIGIMSVRFTNSSSNNKTIIYTNVKEHMPWIIETLEP